MKTGMVLQMTLSLCMCVAVTASEAAVLGVPEPYSSIQEGIDAAAPGDTVLVAPGTYVESLNFNGKLNITVGSYFITTGDTSYVEKTVIGPETPDSVVEFASGEDSTSVLAGFVLTNGYTPDPADTETWCNGGAVTCMDSSPRLDHLIVRENQCYLGSYSSGILCINSSPTITNTVITRNSNTHGVGLYCSNYSSPRVENVQILQNYMAYMDIFTSYNGIYCKDHSSPLIKNVTTFGISCTNSDPVIAQCEITGRISCTSSSPVFRNVVQTGTILSDFQNAIYIGGSGSPLFENLYSTVVMSFGDIIVCTDTSAPVFRNVIIDSGDYFDSAISCYEWSSPLFMNMTLKRGVSNFVTYAFYGIICRDSATPRIINSIITGHPKCGIYQIGGTVSVSHSNIWGNKMGNFNGVTNSLGVLDRVNANGNSCDAWYNISTDPKFAEGFHLSEGSPCIGAGTSENAPEFDIEGVSRHIPPDIGAYEFARMVSVKEDAPVRFSLLANYPNPFNPSTTIPFSLAAPGEVELAVYSVTGQRVRTLLAGYMAAGTYNITWDGRDDSGKSVSSGVYLSRLTSGANIAVGKMLLMK